MMQKGMAGGNSKELQQPRPRCSRVLCSADEKKGRKARKGKKTAKITMIENLGKNTPDSSKTSNFLRKVFFYINYLILFFVFEFDSHVLQWFCRKLDGGIERGGSPWYRIFWPPELFEKAWKVAAREKPVTVA